MESFVCTIESVIFRDETQGFSILHVKREKDGPTIILINMIEVHLGITIKVEGNWRNDRRFGKEFVVDTYEEVLPTTKHGIEKYLCSGLIKGIGPSYAKAIVNMFGDRTFEIIDTKSEEILKVPRLGMTRVQGLWDSWDRQKGIREVMIFLKKYDISTNLGVKVYNLYGDKSIELLQENPYRLVYDIDGVGFPTADTIALRMGFEETHPLRLSSAATYILKTDCEDNGNTYMTIDSLCGKTCELLSIMPDYIKECVETLVDEEKLKREGDNIFLPYLYNAEINISKTLFYKANSPTIFTPVSEFSIERLEKISGIQYEEEQKEAIRKTMNSNVVVITGGPGTGKTTITHGIVLALQSMGLRILMAAPTGKAADRMSNATGFEAKTIHRLLKANPISGFEHNEDNPLVGDVVIVDEVSMVSVSLMNSLLKAVPEHMKVILIGDVDQLPCIGPGNVLKDLIESETLPIIRLTKIFRQAQGSNIIANAHKVNNGEMPYVSNTKDSDFFFIRGIEEDKLPEKVIELVQDRLSKTYKLDPKEIQVLTPMKKNKAGTINLNNALQAALNPTGTSLKYGETIFRVGDKVIQTKNNYEKNIFNGDTGIIDSVDPEERTLTVDYDGDKVFYDSDDLNELLLAYALTIHKSQGSEYPIVVMPIANSHYFMMSKNLIYTGITRSKKICVLVGSEEALRYGLHNVKLAKRNTMLKDRLINLKTA